MLTQKTILSLFDFSGVWSSFYKNNGYRVIQIDIKLNQKPNDIFDIDEKYLDSIGPVYGILAAPPCFIPKTLVRTERGNKPIEELLIGEKVLTHTNSYKTISNFYKTFVNQDLLNLKFSSSDVITCTKAHPFLCIKKIGRKKYTEPYWVNAKDLTQDHFACLGECPEKPNKLSKINDLKIEFPNLPFDSENFWWIVGKYLGDGWVRNQPRRHCVNICGGLKNKEEFDVMREKISSVFKYSFSLQKTAFRFHIYKKELVFFLEKFGKYCEGKFVPSFVNILDNNLIKSLLDGYYFADGDENIKKNLISCTSVSKRLIYDIAFLTQEIYNTGYSIFYYKGRDKSNFIDGREIKTNPIYQLRFKSKPSKIEGMSFVKIYNKIWTRLRKVEDKHYEGYVYNLEVEEDNSYTVNNIVCHNCTAFSGAGARWWKRQDQDGTTRECCLMAIKTLEIIEYCKPKFWAVENPVGRLNKMIPEFAKYGPRYFQPYFYGEKYSKKTGLWGKFNFPEPTNIVEPEGNRPGQPNAWYSKVGGKSEKTKEYRSMTPRGFAEAFYNCNK